MYNPHAPDDPTTWTYASYLPEDEFGDVDFSVVPPNAMPSFLPDDDEHVPGQHSQYEQEGYLSQQEAPAFYEGDYADVPPNDVSSFVWDDYDQPDQDQDELQGQQEYDDKLDRSCRPYYEAWLELPPDQRPLPTGEVIAGCLNKYMTKKLSHYLPYFEAMHGIPMGSLRRDPNGEDFTLLPTGAGWQPAGHTGECYLSDDQMGVLWGIAQEDCGSTEAYQLWDKQPVRERVFPTRKVIAGWAGEPELDYCRAADVPGFEAAKGIPKGTFKIIRSGNRARTMADVVLAGGPGSWQPEKHSAGVQLTDQQLKVQRFITRKTTTPEEAFNAWMRLPREERIEPHLRVVAGVSKKKHGRLAKSSDLEAFEKIAGLKGNDLAFDMANGRPIGLVITGGRKWSDLTSSDPVAGPSVVSDARGQGGDEPGDFAELPQAMPQALTDNAAYYSGMPAFGSGVSVFGVSSSTDRMSLLSESGNEYLYASAGPGGYDFGAHESAPQQNAQHTAPVAAHYSSHQYQARPNGKGPAR